MKYTVLCTVHWHRTLKYRIVDKAIPYGAKGRISNPGSDMCKIFSVPLSFFKQTTLIEMVLFPQKHVRKGV